MKNDVVLPGHTESERKAGKHKAYPNCNFYKEQKEVTPVNVRLFLSTFRAKRLITYLEPKLKVLKKKNNFDIRYKLDKSIKLEKK